MATLITGAGLVGMTTAARLVRDRGERPVLYAIAFSAENLRDLLPAGGATLIQGDITDAPELIQALKVHRIERIIHTAGLLTGAIRERPYAGVRVNLVGTASVLEAARVAGVKRVVCCSSNTVALGLQGTPSAPGLPEDFSMRVVSEFPPSIYAAPKLAGEWLGHGYSQEYGLQVVSLRLGGVFGPWRGIPSGGPSKLARQLIEDAWRGRRCRVTRAEVQRGGVDYIYSADVAQAAGKAAYAEPLRGRVYNIAMGRLYDVPQILAIVERVTGKRVEVDVVEGHSFSGYATQSQPADVRRAQVELGWVLQFPMEEAVRAYLAWLEASAPEG